MQSIVFSLISIYLLLCLLLFLSQRSLLYFPQPSVPLMGVKSVSFQVGDIELRGVVINPGQARAIIYYGGNGEVVELNQAQFLKLPDYSVYLVPYRGYGNNPGKPTEKQLYRDALKVYDEIAHNYLTVSLIGRSLGSGIATYVASQRVVERLALITPYDSIAAVAQTQYPIFPVRYLIQDVYASIDRVKAIKAKTLILIAENDRIIPRKHSENLARAFAGRQADKVIILGAGHNNIADFSRYESVLAEFFSCHPANAQE